MDGQQGVALSAADVQALRRAEQVTCHHVDGASFLWLSLDGGLSGEPPRVLTASQQRLFPDPDRSAGGPGHGAFRAPPPSPGTTSTGDGRWTTWRTASAFATVLPRRDSWRTVVDLLRAGDRLTLVWLAGNNNQYLDEAELFLDEVCLAVARGQRRLVFRVAHTVTADNTARMIRRLR